MVVELSLPRRKIVRGEGKVEVQDGSGRCLGFQVSLEGPLLPVTIRELIGTSALIEAEPQDYLGSENPGIATMPSLVVALPGKVGDHERAASFQSRNSYSGTILETRHCVRARDPGKPPRG